MKHPIFLLLAFVLTFACQLPAQTGKGGVAFGLHNFSPVLATAQFLAPTNAFGIAFGKNKYEYGTSTDESKFTTVGLSGSVHYFLVDNLSGGINLNLFYQKNKDEGMTRNESTLTLIMAGPELRYYVNAGANSKVFFKGNASFGSAKDKYDSTFGNNESTSTISQFGGGAGLTIFLNPQIGLDLGLGYGIFKIKDEDDDTNTISGVSIDVGFTVFLQ